MERLGVPLLVYRDGEGRQRILPIEGSAGACGSGAANRPTSACPRTARCPASTLRWSSSAASAPCSTTASPGTAPSSTRSGWVVAAPSRRRCDPDRADPDRLQASDERRARADDRRERRGRGSRRLPRPAARARLPLPAVQGRHVLRDAGDERRDRGRAPPQRRCRQDPPPRAVRSSSSATSRRAASARRWSSGPCRAASSPRGTSTPTTPG